MEHIDGSNRWMEHIDGSRRWNTNMVHIDKLNTQIVQIDRRNGTHSHLVAGFISIVWKNLEPGESWNPQTPTTKMYMKPAETWYPEYLKPRGTWNPYTVNTHNLELRRTRSYLEPINTTAKRYLKPGVTWSLEKPDTKRYMSLEKPSTLEVPGT